MEEKSEMFAVAVRWGDNFSLFAYNKHIELLNKEDAIERAQKEIDSGIKPDDIRIVAFSCVPLAED